MKKPAALLLVRLIGKIVHPFSAYVVLHIDQWATGMAKKPFIKKIYDLV
jgi:hypothetical protein